MLFLLFYIQKLFICLMICLICCFLSSNVPYVSAGLRRRPLHGRPEVPSLRQQLFAHVPGPGDEPGLQEEVRRGLQLPRRLLPRPRWHLRAYHRLPLRVRVQGVQAWLRDAPATTRRERHGVVRDSGREGREKGEARPGATRGGVMTSVLAIAQ